MIKAIIFDMDGVLIDAKDWHYEALNRALRLFGHEISRHAHLTAYDGLPTRKKLEMLSIESGLPRGLHEFINELKQNYTMEYIQTRCKPRFTHEFALSRLKTMNYRMAVASNAIRKSVDTMLAKSCLVEYFEFTLCNEDVTYPKPHPAIYHESIRRLGYKPSECLVLEDNENGVRAAQHAGAHVMIINTVDDVRLDAIQAFINTIENAK